tara:strand:+ start:231 stop:698 length:468 start_codon:yes stop_codon:yes gene_type:complete
MALSSKVRKLTSLLNLKVPDVSLGARSEQRIMLGKLGKQKEGLRKSIKKLREDLKAGKYKGDDKANMQRRLKRDVEMLAKITAKTKNMNQGGDLKPIPAGNKGKGLSKLPTNVRNNMGFMKKGGMLKKPFGNIDFRMNKGGLLIAIIDKIKKKKT